MDKSDVPFIPSPRLKWLSKKAAGTVGYCVPFEAKAAACTEYVGGKGASLALLASVQEEEVFFFIFSFMLWSRVLRYFNLMRSM